MTSAQVVETSVTNNSSFQNYTNPDDHTIRTTKYKTTLIFQNFEATIFNEYFINILVWPPLFYLLSFVFCVHTQIFLLTISIQFLLRKATTLFIFFFNHVLETKQIENFWTLVGLVKKIFKVDRYCMALVLERRCIVIHSLYKFAFLIAPIKSARAFDDHRLRNHVFELTTSRTMNFVVCFVTWNQTASVIISKSNLVEMMEHINVNWMMLLMKKTKVNLIADRNYIYRGAEASTINNHR